MENLLVLNTISEEIKKAAERIEKKEPTTMRYRFNITQYARGYATCAYDNKLISYYRFSNFINQIEILIDINNEERRGE